MIRMPLSWSAPFSVGGASNDCFIFSWAQCKVWNLRFVQSLEARGSVSLRSSRAILCCRRFADGGLLQSVMQSDGNARHDCAALPTRFSVYFPPLRESRSAGPPLRAVLIRVAHALCQLRGLRVVSFVLCRGALQRRLFIEASTSCEAAGATTAAGGESPRQASGGCTAAAACCGGVETKRTAGLLLVVLRDNDDHLTTRMPT